MSRLLIIPLIFIFLSCSSTQIPSSEEAVIVMQKTPCFGSCPEYGLMIFKGGKVVIDAKQHLDLEKGRYVGQMTDEAYMALINDFLEEGIYDFEDEYTSNITDLPTTNLTFRHDGKEKRIMDYHGAPESLKRLEKQVHSLIAELEWEKVQED